MFDPPKLPRIKGSMHPRFEEILTPEALAFVARLDGAHSGRRAELLAARRERGKRISAGDAVDFLASTADIRTDTLWRVAPPAPGLEDRRCEITGPPTRKMSINALNSGAKVWMADFEDATAPSWSNVIDGQINLYDAIRGNLSFDAEDGKEYRVGDVTPTIVVRPRGWRLCEKHISIDGRPLPAALVDFGLFFFHNAQKLIDGGAGPYFYLPKLESHLEARLWNDVFVQAQALLGIPQGTIRATVLIETLPAAFEMEEILYELRDHSSGLNAGRWDYIFSLHQDLRPARRRVRAAGPLADHHDHPVHAVVHRTAGLDLSSPGRACDRRDGGVRAEQGRPGGHRAGPGQGQGGQDQGGRRRLRRLLGRAPGSGARPAPRPSPWCSATGRTSSTSSVRTCTSRPPS